MISKGKLIFYFDYIDPGSYLVDQLMDGLVVDKDKIILHPLEIRPPPLSRINPSNPHWISYRDKVQQLAKESGLVLNDPTSPPWSRKAHELRLYAKDKGLEQLIHKEIFKAHFCQGLDIGRIDMLVSIGINAGMNTSECKATLDVDKYSHDIAQLGRAATDDGIKYTPVLRTEGDSLEGVANIRELRKFLVRSGINVSMDINNHFKS